MRNAARFSAAAWPAAELFDGNTGSAAVQSAARRSTGSGSRYGVVGFAQHALGDPEIQQLHAGFGDQYVCGF